MIDKNIVITFLEKVGTWPIWLVIIFVGFFAYLYWLKCRTKVLIAPYKYGVKKQLKSRQQKNR